MKSKSKSKPAASDNPIAEHIEAETVDRIAKFLDRVADEKDDVVLAAAATWIRNGEWRE